MKNFLCKRCGCTRYIVWFGTFRTCADRYHPEEPREPITTDSGSQGDARRADAM